MIFLYSSCEPGHDGEVRASDAYQLQNARKNEGKH